MNDHAAQLAGGFVTADAAADQEFEARLVESSTLAFRVAFSVLRQREDAEDVAQEAFAKAYRSFQQLRDRDRFRAWLVRMTWRMALDRQRAIRRRLAREVLAHRDERVPLRVVDDLALHESADDLPLWLAALALPSANVRARAAGSVGRLGHPDATKALVKALDDPSSQVRNAAIASLQAIEKLDDLKQKWRDRVR